MSFLLTIEALTVAFLGEFLGPIGSIVGVVLVGYFAASVMPAHADLFRKSDAILFIGFWSAAMIWMALITFNILFGLSSVGTRPLNVGLLIQGMLSQFIGNFTPAAAFGLCLSVGLIIRRISKGVTN